VDSYHEKLLAAIGFIATSRSLSRVVSAYCLVQGVLILVGGTARFSAPGYTAALAVPGAPAIWGVIIILCGVLMVAGVSSRRNRLTALGAALASVWSFFFAITFLRSAIDIPEANLTAIAAYGKDGVLFMVITVGLLIHNPKKVIR
jgi:predicted neutral ceramidase superfamily lipid hydrolase